MKSPAFQFYVNDFLGSAKVGVMSAQEVGIYLLLLLLDWQETGFALDVPMLARWCRVDEPAFKGGWTVVGRCFERRGERWFNARLDEERKKQAAWREKSRLGGIASGRSRLGAEPPLKGGSRVVEPKGNTPFPSSTPSSKEATTAPAAPVSEGHTERPKATALPGKLGIGDVMVALRHFGYLDQHCPVDGGWSERRDGSVAKQLLAKTRHPDSLMHAIEGVRLLAEDGAIAFVKPGQPFTLRVLNGVNSGDYSLYTQAQNRYLAGKPDRAAPRREHAEPTAIGDVIAAAGEGTSWFPTRKTA